MFCAQQCSRSPCFDLSQSRLAAGHCAREVPHIVDARPAKAIDGSEASLGQQLDAVGVPAMGLQGELIHLIKFLFSPAGLQGCRACGAAGLRG